MNFGEAVEKMKSGMQVARQGWNGKGMYVYLITSCTWQRLGSIWTGEPCIVMHTAAGVEQPGWLASQADMLAEDWEIV